MENKDKIVALRIDNTFLGYVNSFEEALQKYGTKDGLRLMSLKEYKNIKSIDESFIRE